MEMQANFRPDLLGNIEPFEVDKLLYRLVTVFKSSREIALGAAENDGFMQKLKERFEISEAMTVISLLAVTMRNSLDNGTHSAQFKIQVGHLFDPVASEVAKPLFFREACNKVIHSRHINYDMDKVEGTETWFLNSVIHCYGNYQNIEWKAVIDIVRFCEIAHKII